VSADTLADVIGHYIEYLQAVGRPATTVTVVRSSLHLFLVFAGPVSITTAVQQAIPFLAHRARTCRRNTHVASFNQLKAFFAYSVRFGYIKANPLADMKRPRDEIVVTQPLSDREILALYEAANDWQRAAIVLLLGSGMRIAELANLRWDELRDGQVLVHGKGHKQRLLAPGGTAMALLYQLPRTRGTVFPLAYQSIKVGLARLARRAQVPFNPRQLRHTFAHRFLEAGGAIEDLSELMGHARLDTTAIYVRAYRRERALDAQRRFNPADALFRAVGPSYDRAAGA